MDTSEYKERTRDKTSKVRRQDEGSYVKKAEDQMEAAELARKFSFVEADDSGFLYRVGDLVSVNDGWNEAAAEDARVIHGVVVDRAHSEASADMSKPLPFEMYKVVRLDDTSHWRDWYTELDLDIVSSAAEDTKKE